MRLSPPGRQSEILISIDKSMSTRSTALSTFGFSSKGHPSSGMRQQCQRSQRFMPLIAVGGRIP